ncbi:MAG: hypothetical protein P4L92_15755 [Rudaea sp.]|nr:hypothetical protein [Rudaea sp.]
MNTISPSFSGNRASYIAVSVLMAGAIAGSLDLAFAFSFYGLHGASPLRILQSIASGLLGMSAFTGGWMAAALGAVCHYFILIVAAFLYLAASRRFVALSRHAIVCGLLYGVAIYLFMHFIVLPLSAAPSFKPIPGAVYGELMSHFTVGLSIALVMRRRFRAVT